MADNFVRHASTGVNTGTSGRERHFSIVKVFRAEDYVFERCGNENCQNPRCSGKDLHCPLCPVEIIAKEKPSRMREHFMEVHVKKRVCDGGKAVIKKIALTL